MVGMDGGGKRFGFIFEIINITTSYPTSVLGYLGEWMRVRSLNEAL